MVITSIPECLLPEDAAKIFHPSLLDIRMGGFHHNCLIRLPLPEPDLKAGARVAHLGRESNIGRLHTLFIDVNIQIL